LANVIARANHARVVIDTIQTGGIDGGLSPLGAGAIVPATVAPRQMSPPVPSASYANIDMGRMQVLESMSSLTASKTVPGPIS
jgi:hypothetical protein